MAKPQTLAPGSYHLSGFTMLELLVVLLIVSLLAAAMPLAMTRVLTARRVDNLAAQIVTSVRDAQGLSRVRGVPVTLQLQGSRLRCVPADERRCRVSWGSAITVRLVDAQGQSMGGLTVLPDGTAQGAAFEVSAGRQVRRMIVSSLTGRIRNAG